MQSNCIRVAILHCIIGVAPVFSSQSSQWECPLILAVSASESHDLLLIRCFPFPLAMLMVMSSVHGVFFAFLTSSQALAVLRHACFTQGYGQVRRRGTGIKRDNHVNSCSDLTQLLPLYSNKVGT